jgi:pyruvate formate lyase activating enzyme
MLKEALLYEKLEENRVLCHLCSHRCRIGDGKFGVCDVRENRGGILYTHTYGNLVAQNVDPIEKKPLYHFLPGSTSYSIATAGCNFRCDFCQNWQISQVTEAERLSVRAREVKPEDVVRQAKATGSSSISYTYTEPTIFFEFAYDCAKIAKKEGLYNVLVTNGYMTEEMLRMFHPCLDAANVDLKSFMDDFYKKICKARLQPVLDSIRTMKKMGIWIEVTTLVVPGQNDSEEELKDIAAYIASVDVSIPWHISRFHPQYKMDHVEPTPMKTLNRAYDIGGEAGLRYVYLGNVLGNKNHTYCYKCRTLLIERGGFSVQAYHVSGGRCPKCGTVQDGIGL